MPGFSSADPLLAVETPIRQAVRFAVILAAHVAVLWGGFQAATRPELRTAAKELMVSLIEAPLPEVAPPQVVPPPPVPQPTRKPKPLPVAVESKAPAPVETVEAAPQPPQPATELTAAAVTEARFDADYLSNPKPVYPIASRRFGEEGKVLLRVKVSPGGTPTAVEIKRPSGFPRLDAAAKTAVERWRFVPAQRGDDAIESWVTVPIVFSLKAA
ncbi:MAG: energy transducer TonB [Gammaproteobacteria bacterium]|nr:energy transducer TonB [Gammaproteobacteria bacterium]MBU1416317.1 energy transducer TonB [Gammaproteobacteria bacterium]